jgi:phage terminase large subunit-like protein
MSSDKWSREACLLARDIDADRIVFESNYGGDQAGTLIKQAWVALQHETNPETGEPFISPRHLCPMITGVAARKSKLLRAEPIAQAVLTGRAWFSGAHELKGLKNEWMMWEPGSSWSPGALDAAVYVAYELLPPVASGARSVSVAGKRKDDARPARGVAARRIVR